MLLFWCSLHVFENALLLAVLGRRWAAYLSSTFVVLSHFHLCLASYGGERVLRIDGGGDWSRSINMWSYESNDLGDGEHGRGLE